MTAKSVLLRPQALRPRARAPSCPSCYATGICWASALSSNGDNNCAESKQLHYNWDIERVRVYLLFLLRKFFWEMSPSFHSLQITPKRLVVESWNFHTM